MREQWDAYNKHWEPLGYRLFRDEPLKSTEYHLICEVFITHEDGDILLVQRSFDKVGFPGYFEVSAGGSVLAGESALQAAKREVFEETGISDGIFTEVGRNRFDDDHCLNVSFHCKTSIEKTQIYLQEQEAVSYRWVSPAWYVEALYDANSKGLLLIPDQKERHKRYYFSYSSEERKI